MFSIGKLAAYNGPNDEKSVGRIVMINPNNGMNIYFSADHIYENSILLKHPEKVKCGSYVALNLSYRRNSDRILINKVAMINEVKPDSLLRLIQENSHSGTDIDLIIEKYCTKSMDNIESNITEERPVKEEDHDQVTVDDNALADSDIIQSYIEYLEGRGVKYFVHFTPVNNLDSILENGLRPRSMQAVAGKTTDDLRLDSNMDALSLSISFPNYLMFYKKRKTMGNTKFVVLEIDIKALNELNPKQIAFYAQNAARKDSITTDFSEHCSLEQLKTMFAETELRSSDLPREYTTDPQAEVMIKGIIPSKYISEFVFDDSFVLLEYFNKYQFSCNTNSKLFGPRRDYSVWQKKTDDTNNDLVDVPSFDDWRPF